MRGGIYGQSLWETEERNLSYEGTVDNFLWEREGAGRGGGRRGGDRWGGDALPTSVNHTQGAFRLMKAVLDEAHPHYVTRVYN